MLDDGLAASGGLLDSSPDELFAFAGNQRSGILPPGGVVVSGIASHKHLP